MNETIDIKVRDTVFDPAQSGCRDVNVRTGSDKSLYKVWIYLEGPALPYVEKVTYHLHPTFRNSPLTVSRNIANSNCQIIIWTWGLFIVHVVIEDKMGHIYELDYPLSYDKELENTSEIKYVWDADQPINRPQMKSM